MSFISLAVLTALCLLLASTRKYAVFGAGLLLYFYPFFHSASWPWLESPSFTSKGEIHMHYQDCLTEALELVSAWDIPDEQFADAVNAQARLMAGINPDELWETPTN